MFSVFWLPATKGVLSDSILTLFSQQRSKIVPFASVFLGMFLMAQLPCYQFRFQQHGLDGT